MFYNVLFVFVVLLFIVLEYQSFWQVNWNGNMYQRLCFLFPNEEVASAKLIVYLFNVFLYLLKRNYVSFKVVLKLWGGRLVTGMWIQRPSMEFKLRLLNCFSYCSFMDSSSINSMRLNCTKKTSFYRIKPFINFCLHGLTGGNSNQGSHTCRGREEDFVCYI